MDVGTVGAVLLVESQDARRAGAGDAFAGRAIAGGHGTTDAADARAVGAQATVDLGVALDEGRGAGGGPGRGGVAVGEAVVSVALHRQR